MNETLVFLKLGGSLITEKDKVATPRPEVLTRLAAEIAAARAAQPGMRLLLGHGSGSFGHVPAKKYNTRAGAKSPEEWTGFAEVWQRAAALNHIVMDTLQTAGLPAIAFPPSAAVMANGGQIKSWNIEPIQAALDANLLPVVYGDVAFDAERGGTILSTEDLLVYLALTLHPTRILLAGDEDGIYEDYPQRKNLVAEITPNSYGQLAASLGGAAAADVTGGMAGKVQTMLELVKTLPECEVRIFSGRKAGAVQEALSGKPLGSRVRAD
jgi:isopentenyl phosphate kinase